MFIFIAFNCRIFGICWVCCSSAKQNIACSVDERMQKSNASFVSARAWKLVEREQRSIMRARLAIRISKLFRIFRCFIPLSCESLRNVLATLSICPKVRKIEKQKRGRQNWMEWERKKTHTFFMIFSLFVYIVRCDAFAMQSLLRMLLVAIYGLANSYLRQSEKHDDRRSDWSNQKEKNK